MLLAWGGGEKRSEGKEKIMRHWSRKNKQRLTRQFRVEHIAEKMIKDFLSKKGLGRERVWR